jgi:hypothetical protein
MSPTNPNFSAKKPGFSEKNRVFDFDAGNAEKAHHESLLTKHSFG